MQYRTSNVGEENLRTLGPLTGFFSRIGPPTYTLEEAMSEIITETRSGKLPFSLKELRIALSLCQDFSQEKKRGDPGSTHLTQQEIASLALYTMEFADRENSFYSVMNGLLRGNDRSGLKPFIKVIWLIMHALKKCPAYDGHTVFRGVTKAVEGYEKGRTVPWHQFSSCTCSIEVQQQFLGQNGPRTLFQIELSTKRSRMISNYSVFPLEQEVLLPPNTRYEVVSRWDAGNGLTLIQLKELPPLDPILDFDDVDVVVRSLSPAGVKNVAPPSLSPAGVKNVAPPSLSPAGVKNVAPPSLSPAGVKNVAPHTLSPAGVKNVAPPSFSPPGVKNVAPLPANNITPSVLPKDKSGHDMPYTTWPGKHNPINYTGGWICDLCRKRSSTDPTSSWSSGRYFCIKCHADICITCFASMTLPAPVPEKTNTITRSVFPKDKCGHDMPYTTWPGKHNPDGYKNGWICDLCTKRSSTDPTSSWSSGRYFCIKCHSDMCITCFDNAKGSNLPVDDKGHKLHLNIYVPGNHNSSSYAKGWRCNLCREVSYSKNEKWASLRFHCQSCTYDLCVSCKGK